MVSQSKIKERVLHGGFGARLANPAIAFCTFAVNSARVDPPILSHVTCNMSEKKITRIR